MNQIVIFSWDKNLETGIALVDQQHKQILQAINKLLICHKCNHGADQIEECLGFLEHYIQYHFQSEEAFQVECGYAAYRDHQAKHHYLNTQVKFFTVKLRASAYAPQELEAFYRFVCNWVQDHILSDDIQFAKAYRDFHASIADTTPS